MSGELVDGQDDVLALAARRLQPELEVERVIGRGAMGLVVAAKSASLGRVAVKLLNEAHLADPVARERLQREATATGSLRHPNIVRVISFDEARAFIVMELIEGESLKERLQRENALAPEQVRNIGRAILGALDSAHRAGIIHRDVKPSNILLAKSGAILLADFGVAQLDSSITPGLTMTGSFIGTPAYVAPEQLRGHKLDRRTDIYATGATLFEAATGELLHSENRWIGDPRAYLQKQTGDDDLASAIARALAEKPEDRFPDAASFAGALAVRDPRSRAKRGSRVLPIIALVSALGALATIAVFQPATPARHKKDGPTRIAVLPFEDNSGIPELDFAGTGLPHLLAGELGRTPGILVIGRHELEKFIAPTDGGGALNWNLAAGSAGADRVVEGKLSRPKDDDRVRIDISLATATGEREWSATHLVPPKDVPDVVAGSALKIAEQALGHPVTIAPRTTKGFDFDRYFLQGVHALEQNQLIAAKLALSRAEDLNAGSGEVHYYLALLGFWQNAHSSEVRLHIQRAIELGVSDGQCSFLEGLALLERRQYFEAVAHFKGASERFPSDRHILYGLFEAEFHSGNGPPAVEAYRRLVTLDPRFRLGAYHILTYATLRADEPLMEWALRHADADRDPLQASWTAKTLIAKREYGKALEDLQRRTDILRNTPSDQLAEDLLRTLVAVYALTAHTDLALTALDRLGDGNLDDLLVRYGLQLVRGEDTTAQNIRNAILAELSKKSHGDVIERWIRLILIELAHRDANAIRPLIEQLRRAVSEEGAPDHRLAMIEILFAAHHGGELGERSEYADHHPELSAAREALAAQLSGDHASAARSWAIAAANSVDGRFVLVEHALAAKASRACDDHQGVIRECDEVIRPRLLNWEWSTLVGPCRSWVTEAKEALR